MTSAATKRRLAHVERMLAHCEAEMARLARFHPIQTKNTAKRAPQMPTGAFSGPPLDDPTPPIPTIQKSQRDAYGPWVPAPTPRADLTIMPTNADGRPLTFDQRLRALRDAYTAGYAPWIEPGATRNLIELED